MFILFLKTALSTNFIFNKILNAQKGSYIIDSIKLNKHRTET